MQLRTKTKAAIILLNINYLVACVLFLLCFYLISNYDFFELRASYYLKKDKQLVWGQLDNKWVVNGLEEDQGQLRYAYDFSFKIESKGTFKGTSYSYFNKFNPKDSLRIEYVPWGPSYSRIVRFDAIRKSDYTLNISGAIFIITLLYLLFSISSRILLISRLKRGQIIPVEFHFANHINWLIPDFYKSKTEGSWRDYMAKMTYSYKLEGEKKQQFAIIRFKLNKFYFPSQMGITRGNKRPLLLTFLPKPVLRLITEDNKGSN